MKTMNEIIFEELVKYADTYNTMLDYYSSRYAIVVTERDIIKALTYFNGALELASHLCGNVFSKMDYSITVEIGDKSYNPIKIVNVENSKFILEY